MQCTECSRELLPIVVFDVDGTLAEYHRGLGMFCWNYWAIPNTGPLAIRAGSWDGQGNFEDYLGIDQEQYREAKLAWRQGGGKRMMDPIQEGMLLYRHVRGIDEEETSRVGATMYRGDMLKVEMWIVTHRPYRRLDNVDPDTRWWLNKFGISYDHLLFSDDKYPALCEQVDSERIIAIFEDLPEYVDQAAGMGLPVVQVARPHNRGAGVSRPQRATLEQATYWYDDQVRQWRKQNDRSEA